METRAGELKSDIQHPTSLLAAAKKKKPCQVLAEQLWLPMAAEDAVANTCLARELPLN